jgi:ABC-2 type transport system ATP-binding protein
MQPREAGVGGVAVHTENLTRTFGALCAVDRVNLHIPSGTLFGLLGPAGSGKSTTIRLLLGLLEPTAGSATVLGYDIHTQGDRIRQHTGALLAYSGLYDRLTALENLDFFGRIWHMPTAERRARAKELLNGLGLWEHRDALVGSWDRGRRRKLSLARAIFHRPSLVFIDEPTDRLDPAESEAIWTDLDNLATRENMTVFLATHLISEAEALCSTVAVMRQGQILETGSLAELRARTAAPQLEIVGRGFTDQVIALISRRAEVASARRIDNRLVLQLSGDHDTAPLVSLLVEASADIEEVRKHQPDLQSAFVALAQAAYEEESP